MASRTCQQIFRRFSISLLAILSLLCAKVDAQTLPFRAHLINAESEFTAAAALDVNADGRLDIVSGGWWYAAPDWKKFKLREVERIGTRFDDYSNLTMDVDQDGDTDLISVNYRSKSMYWVRNPGPIASSQGAIWQRVMIDVPGASETGRLVDIDQDGKFDILPNGTTFAAWYSLEKKEQEPHWLKHDLPPEVAGHGVGAGDINGDGRIDLVTTNGWAEGPADARQGRWLWHPDFKLVRDGSVPILVQDVDGDGDNDLVWGRGHNVGVYWTEQRRLPTDRPKVDASAFKNPGPMIGATLDFLFDQSISQVTSSQSHVMWVTHAIDTSWSCAHCPLWADLDGDGIDEFVVGKRYQGHEGRDPGENEPLRVTSYQFDRQHHTWQQRLVSLHPMCGLDLDPKIVDIDADGDLDIIAPARSGLVLLENLRNSQNGLPSTEQFASARPKLPEDIDHRDILKLKFNRPESDQQTPITTAITTALEMGQRREQIQAQMETVMGPLPDSSRRVPLDVRIDKIESTDRYARILLTYAPETGDRVPAWLLIPHGIATTAPAMLCLHPTQFELGKDQLLGLGGKPSRFYAHELAEKGFVCLVPDYPGFGQYKYDFATQGKHYASGTMKAIWNNVRAMDLLESLPIVKADAIGCIGHSLGGHNALFTAAFDVRVRAVMSSCGFNAFEDYYGGQLKGWSSDRYMPRVATEFQNDPKRMPFDFPEVLAAIAPRPLLINAPLRDANFEVVGVRKCQTAVAPVYQLLGKPDNVRFLYPDSDHDFPDAIRQLTYQWFAEQLKP